MVALEEDYEQLSATFAAVHSTLRFLALASSLSATYAAVHFAICGMIELPKLSATYAAVHYYQFNNSP